MTQLYPSLIEITIGGERLFVTSQWADIVRSIVRQAASAHSDAVVLRITGVQKEARIIALIKEVRSFFGLSLKEAKAKVDALRSYGGLTYTPIELGVYPYTQAANIAAQFEATGAIVPVPTPLELLALTMEGEEG
jgi:ribosomal protein L7/L12